MKWEQQRTQQKLLFGAETDIDSKIVKILN